MQLTSVAEICNCAVYIIDDIFVFCIDGLLYTADRGSLMNPPNAKAVSGNAPPLLMLHTA